MSRVHISANKLRGGSESRIVRALRDGDIVVSGGNDDTLTWLRSRCADVRPCPMSGFLAPLNLSRVLRHLPAGEHQLLCHRGCDFAMVQRAAGLSGRVGDLSVCEYVEPAISECSSNKVIPPASPVRFFWSGRIKPGCGLDAVIEAFGRLADDSRWHLTVAGHGEAKFVTPILQKARKADIYSRVNWAGFVDDTAPLLSEADYAVISRSEPETHAVYFEAADAAVPVICASHADKLTSLIKQCLNR